MKSSLFLILSFLVVSCTNQHKDIVNSESDYKIIPKPVSLEISNGRFPIDSETKVYATSDLQTEGNYLALLLSTTSGQTVTFSTNAGDGNIQLKLDDKIESAEGYVLSATHEKIVIGGRTAKGVFYGIQTLKQLIPITVTSKNEDVSEFTVPALLIEDEPRFGYRGMMLDVGRHYFPVSFIKEYIDLIAMHKMNTLHWHLTEDQGWRIEIKKYPKLTEVGAYRNGTIVGHLPGTANDQTVHGGFYTQEEVKEIVGYAAERHVTVIPEIELPGHSSAAIAAYPFLSCFPQEPTIVNADMMSEKAKK